MLGDLLDSGIYGKSSLSRLHNSKMTLEAVLSDKQGKKGKINLMSSLFPDASVMQSRYVYVRKNKITSSCSLDFSFYSVWKADTHTQKQQCFKIHSNWNTAY